jgi:hypothetical protein
MLLIPLLFAFALGNKTLDMFHELEKGEIVEYNSETKLFLINDKEFQPLTGELEHLSTKPVICVGSYPLGRELFYFDPTNSPLLEAHATTLISLIPENASTLHKLDCVLDYIRATIFELKTCHEGAVKKFIQRRKLISIEEFIQNKIGVCRHLAFVSTYLLDQLIEHHLLSGKVHYIRDIIPQGGHAWSLFIDFTGKMWHLDPLWNVIQSLSDPAEFEILCDLYGQAAMERQLNRSVN